MSSRRISPTPEQRAVIDADDPRLVVVASAGAGKTGTLVERYLRHVEEGIRPDQILTITFTRKAAAEMKERIVAALKERALWDAAQIAETGPIQTIHGFCERLLRENAVAAGLDPEFDVLAEGESSRLIEACVRRAIPMPTPECGQTESLMTLLAGTSDYNAAPNARLESAVKEALLALRGSGASFEDLWRIYEDPTTTMFAWQRAVLDDAGEDVREAMRDVPSGDGFFERLRAAHKACGKRVPKWLATKVEAAADREAAEQACGLMALVCSTWALLDREMVRRQALDFVELEARAVRLLKERPETAERVRRQYKMAMVDEAQDVNPVQYDLLSALGLECEMLVGDHQQSIYGFRQADVELFKGRMASSEPRRLTKNWRSRDGILAFVDTLFGRMWPDGYAPMLPQPEAMDFDAEPPSWEGVEFWLLRDRNAAGTAHYLRELYQEGVPLSETAVLVRGLRAGVELQQALKQLDIPSRIVGGSERFYTRLEIRDLANALCALADPYDDFALLATLRSPFCGLSLDSIVLLASEPPVIEAARALEPALPEDRDRLGRFLTWFEPLARYADRLPAWEVMSELFAESGYLEALARRRNADQLLANVRKLLSLASQEPELGPAEYAARIREIQNLRHREGDAPAEDDRADMVTIMTVHKAKGLEFEVVVVPDTHYAIEPRRQTLEIEPRLGMVVPKFGKTPSPFHSWVSQRRKERAAQEEERVLYVALTRAKKRLCVVAHPRTKRVSCFARTIAQTVGLERGAPRGAVVRDSQDLPDAEE